MSRKVSHPLPARLKEKRARAPRDQITSWRAKHRCGKSGATVNRNRGSTPRNSLVVDQDCLRPALRGWPFSLCSSRAPPLCSPILRGRFRRVAWFALELPASWATLVPRRQLRGEGSAKAESPSTQTRHIVGPKSNFPSTNFSLIISGRS